MPNFFNVVANGRRHANIIDVTEDEGRQLTNEEHKRSYFFHKFRQLFGLHDERSQSQEDWSGLYQTSRLLTPDLLTTLFSIEEVNNAVFQLGVDKALGLDGFLLIFFQTFWETIEEDLFKIFIDLQEDWLFPRPIDYSFICLIPKNGPCRANVFRLISLINGIQKNHL